MEGLIGKKIGMTQVFDAEGNRTCVTVIEVGPCPVVQLKTLENDGYVAAQVGFGAQKKQRLAKAQQKHFEKAGVETMKVLKEFALEDGDKELKVGDKVTVKNFEGVKYVDVTGVTKGKGFAGVLKRYLNMTHGGHSKRRTGGLAARDLPGWIEKGKKMPGHMGDVNRKAMNLEVVAVREEDNALLVKGSIPGARNGIVIVRKSLKNNVKKGAK